MWIDDRDYNQNNHIVKFGVGSTRVRPATVDSGRIEPVNRASHGRPEPLRRSSRETDPDVVALSRGRGALSGRPRRRRWRGPGRCRRGCGGRAASAPRVLPVGAQSSLTGGATPSGDVVISTERLTGIRIIGDRVVAGAGVTLARVAGRAADRRPVAAAGADVSRRDRWRRGVDQRRRRRDLQVRPDARLGHGADGGAAHGDVLTLSRGDVTASARSFVVGDERRRSGVPLPRIRMPDVPKRSAGYHCRARAWISSICSSARKARSA